MSAMILATNLQGVVLGEATNADERKVYLPLNRMPTASFKIRTDHYLSSYFVDPTWDGLIKVYRNGSLIFCGPVVSAEEVDDASGQSVVVNAAGPLWRLGFRLLGSAAAGWALGTTGTTYDLGFIAEQMLAYGNSQGYTGITLGTTATSTTGSAGTYYFKPVSEAIAELSTGLNAFDFEVAPVEPTNIGQAWPKIGSFNYAPLIGTAKPNSVFEFGAGAANVIAYSNQITRDGLLTKGYIQQPAATDHSGTLTATDAAAETARGRFEGVVDDGGVQWDSLRQALVNEHVRIRKQARQIVTFTPAQNASPQPLVDYIVGDQVRARITVNQVLRLDAMLRVWGLTLSYDKSGNESVELELASP